MRAIIKIICLTFCLSQTVNAGHWQHFSLAAVGLDQATKIVLNLKKSKVLSAKTETIAGRVVHIIKVLTKDGHVQYLKVDAESGQII